MYYYDQSRGNKYKKNSLFESVVNRIINTFVDTKSEKLNIKMRYVDILRGENYVNDLRDIFIDKFPEASKFELIDLIMILYTDFIEKIKNGDHSHSTAARYLLEGKRKHLNNLEKRNTITRKEVHQVTPNTLIFEDIEEDDFEDEELEHDDVSVDDIVYFDIDVNSNQNNRCKVFLYDIEPYLNGDKIDVKEVIAICYLSFIDQIRKKGNNPKIMKAILNNFINEKAQE
ncbi:hypothetical protein LG296_20525 (plasmid) [Ureibacillus chungkukjangi]|uniref:hypothetical protein n=1 Tax=Ureibacillus chungkukjangi TaxID=1202712 RepID=UPI000D34F1E0|nr:hypothetical protein [Ureibacillus chungkukjangi]MCM3390433.1 hypothetical protein [Ureibacillus chungkukjangi]